MSTITETKISFYKFKKETNHKHVKFTWSDKEGKKIREFEAEKFYCNVYGKDQLSLPKFGMSKNQEWTQIDSKNFKAVSEYGSTVFEIIDNELYGFPHKKCKTGLYMATKKQARESNCNVCKKPFLDVDQ